MDYATYYSKAKELTIEKYGSTNILKTYNPSVRDELFDELSLFCMRNANDDPVKNKEALTEHKEYFKRFINSFLNG